MPVILATWEAEIERIMVGDKSGQIVLQTLISKITRAKWAGGAAQAAECLLCKHEALHSNSSHQKTKQNETTPPQKTNNPPNPNQPTKQEVNADSPSRRRFLREGDTG
jgi:primosomal protein N''